MPKIGCLFSLSLESEPARLYRSGRLAGYDKYMNRLLNLTRNTCMQQPLAISKLDLSLCYEMTEIDKCVDGLYFYRSVKKSHKSGISIVLFLLQKEAV